MRKKHVIIPIIPTLLLVGLTFFGLAERQNIEDWWRLRDYTPPKQVQDLASATKMNDEGRKLFYVYEPALNDKTAFNQNCTDSEKTLVLGCYVSKQGIYIFDVTDERLAGIEEVTAAHEMLHVAYERLSNRERRWVDNMVVNAFKDVTNERIKTTVQQYREKDPSVVPNELHSILATEVRNLPDELDVYYRRYFTNRSAVVDLSERYEKAFTEREAKVASYDKQLSELKKQIDTLEKSLEERLAKLNAEKSRMDTLLAQKQYDSYNAAVPSFNAQVRSYNSAAAEARKLIEDYNQMVGNRNAVASEENELIKAIDSRPANVETQ
jgi:predicted  nucleic acid-binding Zn-ribbon protein